MALAPKRLAGAIAACAALAACASGLDSASKGGAPVSAVWTQFAEGPPTERPFIDFSAAGVNYGEAGLPSTEHLPAFHVADFGALPDDGRDDGAAIQQAIHAAEKAHGGIVQFAHGRYLLNSLPDKILLRISASYIVLRGSEAGETELFMAAPMPPANPEQLWTGPAMIQFEPPVDPPAAGYATLLAPAAVGDISVRVSDPARFAPGDYVSFDLESPAANARFLKGKPVREIWSRLREPGIGIRERQRIASIEGDALILDQPLLTPLDTDLPWQITPVTMLEHVGVEDLCFTTAFAERFAHHKNATHDSGFRALQLKHTAHSWVRGNCFRNVSNAITLSGGVANSALLNTIQGNSGHFAISSEFATRNLIGLNIDASRFGQFHGPGASHMAVGNVVWRYRALKGSGIDSHARFPRHTLFDLVQMPKLGTWGGSYTNLPHHLSGLVLWNYRQTGPVVGEHYAGTLDFWNLPVDPEVKQGFLTAIDPVVVGYVGPVTRGNHENIGRLESLGAHVSPASLYEAQLGRRLGKRPAWLDEALAEWRELLLAHGHVAQ